MGYRHSDWPDLSMVYASRVKKNPLLSRVHESTASFVKSRLMLNNVRLPLVTAGIDCPDRRNGLGDLGRDRYAWFIPEIASQFFTMGLVIGSSALFSALTA